MSHVLVALVSRDYLTPGDDTPYGYVPTYWITLLFVVIFGLSTATHTVQAVYYRLWVFQWAAVCGIMEIIGWSGRLWSSKNPLNALPFNMQLVMTIIGPTALTVVYFKSFEKVVNILGPVYSRIKPHQYHHTFFVCDLLSLFLQILGGTIATSGDTENESGVGEWITFSGIVVQIISLIVYLILATEFFVRYHGDLPVKKKNRVVEKDGASSSIVPPSRGELTTRVLTMSVALIFGSVCLFIRCVYRTVEIADGFDGRFAHTQVYFNILEGTMIFLAMATLNICHPGWLLAHSVSLHETLTPASETGDSEQKGAK